jgi:uncharacterized protein YecE (DUF72 family)
MTWHGSDAVVRYDYLYHDQELRAWVNRIKRIVIQVKTVYSCISITICGGRRGKNGKRGNL